MPSVVGEGRRVINNIERSAALYLTKNIFSFTFALVSLIFTLPFPITSSQMSLISSITIGIPSFVLAMEPNNSRIQGKFLPNVIYRAFPGGITDFLLILGVVLFCTVFDIGEGIMGTVCTLVMSIVGLIIVHRMCIPYNLLHKALMVVLVLAFAVCIIFVPGLFSLTGIDTGGTLVLIVFVALAWPALKAVTMVEEKVCASFRGLKKPGRHSKPVPEIEKPQKKSKLRLMSKKRR